MKRSSRVLWIAGATATIVAGALLLARRAHSPRAPKHGGKRMLGDALAAAVLESLPTPDTVLGEPSPEWDELLGGRVGDHQWRYYERGYGTTCGVVAAAWLARAGAPPSMINRAPPEGSAEMTPDGQHLGKASIGKHIAKIHDGAEALGWLRKPTGELPDLAADDLLCTEHDAFDKDGKPIKGEHVDVVLSVERDGDELHVETGDGGQEDSQGRQCAKRKQRVIRMSGRDAKVITQGSRDAVVAWWVCLERGDANA